MCGSLSASSLETDLHKFPAGTTPVRVHEIPFYFYISISRRNFEGRLFLSMGLRCEISWKVDDEPLRACSRL